MKTFRQVLEEAQIQERKAAQKSVTKVKRIVYMEYEIGDEASLKSAINQLHRSREQNEKFKMILRINS